VSDDDERAHVPLEHFLGTQYVTHLYRGNDGMLGIDGELFRFCRSYQTCPNKRPYGDYQYDGIHSRFCTVSRLTDIHALSQDELETISMVIALRPINRMITFHRRTDELIYGTDETWGTETSDKIVIELGTHDESVLHDRFAFYYQPKGYTPVWLASPEEPGDSG
jgi:hypothetical protein